METKPRVARAVAVALGIVALIAVVYAIWVQYPKINDEEGVKSTIAGANERFAENQSRASTEALNGYSNPYFLPYWGRTGMEYKDESPARTVIEGWAEYSSHGKGKKVDHAELQAEKDPAYLKALAEFEKIHSELAQSMHKPLFAAPGAKLDLNDVFINLSALKTCAQATVALASARKAQGKDGEAADTVIDVVEWGRHFMNGGTLLDCAFAISIQTIGTEGFIHLVTPETKLDSSQWRKLTDRLVESVPPEDLVLRGFESEIAATHNTIDSFQDKGAVSELAGAPIALPGLMDREVRIYDNIMYKIISDYRETGVAKAPAELSSPSTGDWLVGRAGNFAGIMIPAVDRLPPLADYNRAKVQGLATSVGLLAYRSQKGKFPATLDELKGAGIPTVDEGFLKAAKMTSEGDKVVLDIPFTQQDGVQYPVSGPWEPSWYNLTSDGLTFVLDPGAAEK